MLVGAVRIITPLGSAWQNRRYKSRTAIDSVTIDSNGAGNFYVTYGAVSGTTPAGGSCAPTGVFEFASPFPFVITSQTPDALGGYALSGYVVGGLFLGSSIDYAFYDGVNGAVADVWGGNATIDAFYPSNPKSEYDIAINNWNPPSAAHAAARGRLRP